MREWESQSHVRWYCRYHVVIVPKYRRKAIFGALRKDLGLILKELCRRYEVQLVEGYDEGVIRNYILNQEENDKREDQLSLTFG